MGKIDLNKLKNEIKKTGQSKGKFLYFRPDEKVRVRFLTELDEGMEIMFHDSYALGINVPCQETFGRECAYCDNEELRTRALYAWCVYVYETNEVKILLTAANNCSPVPGLAAMWEAYGTITDRDYEIKQTGSGQGKSFTIIPLTKCKFRNTKVKPISDKAILKAIDKAYPADDVEEDEEETTNRRKGNKRKESFNKKMNAPEDEDWSEDEEEEETEDYESMSARELYKLCNDRGVDCKPRKSKEYYIDLLEQQDEEDDSEDWNEEEDEDWEDE